MTKEFSPHVAHDEYLDAAAREREGYLRELGEQAEQLAHRDQPAHAAREVEEAMHMGAFGI